MTTPRLHLKDITADRLVEDLLTEDAETTNLSLYDALLLIGATWQCDCGQLGISGRKCRTCLADQPA